MKRFVFFGAGFWAIWYSIFIYLILTANYTPDFGRGVDHAIISTIRVMGIFAIGLVGQIGLQIAFASDRETHLSAGEKWFDGITTLLPLASFLLAWWTMKDTEAKVLWWPTLSRWVFWLVLLGICIDLYNAWKGVKIWRGTADAGERHDAVHPPAAAAH